MLPPRFKKEIIKEKKPLVSIVIPTYNEEEDIEDCLNSLYKQTYKKIEIIIVDDGSTDKTREIIKTFKKVQLIEGQHKGPGFSRNLGVKKAKGKIIVLIDADMILFSDYVEKLIKPVIENKALGSIEAIQYNIIKSKMQECWGRLVKLEKIEGVHSPTVRAIAKKDFLNLGGFDPKYGYADDQTFFYKYGIKFLIVKNVKCYHKTPKTMKGVYKQSKWIGAAKMPDIFKLPILNVILLLGLYILSPIAILLLSLRQAHKINRWNILIPSMFVFMTARYFGTLTGYIRRIFLGLNVR